MKRALAPQRHRKDLDDGDPPAFVTEREENVPHCCRCGREVPQARSLWTLCEECIRQSLQIPDAPATNHPKGTSSMVSKLAGRFALTFSQRNGDHTPVQPTAVLWHEENFRRRGCDPTTARRLSESLAVDPVHRAGCAQCRADLTAITETLVRPNEETGRWSEMGRSRLPKRIPR